MAIDSPGPLPVDEPDGGQKKPDTDPDSAEEEEESVPDSAFWHVETSMDTGFQTGMLVEVEHSPCKYWLASVVAAYGRLLSLKWEGAANQPDFWSDLAARKCYPVGYYRDKRDFKIEPPANLRLESKDIVDVTIKYFSKNVQTSNSVKLSLYTKYGLTDPMEVFSEGTLLEVADQREPDQVWFAVVVENCGGRLKMRWLADDDEENNENDQDDNTMHLFFCHPRVNYLGHAFDQESMSYQSPKPIDNVEEVIDRVLREAEDNECNQLIREVITAAKDHRPDIFTNDSLEKTIPGQKVLIFPMRLMQLQPATITSITENHRHLTITSDFDPELRFIYPFDDHQTMMPISWGEDHHINCDFGEELKDEAGWNRYLIKTLSHAAPLHLADEDRLDEFQVNTKLEVVHPNDPAMICEGMISRITAPLIWIEIAPDTITVLPYNSCDIFPLGWCHKNGSQAVRLLKSSKKAKKVDKDSEKDKDLDVKDEDSKSQDEQEMLEETNNDLPHHLQCSPKSWCPRIFINHKCFTGPGLSKSKICELPQYLGPGPIMLVLQEVISKIINVAYVPNRVLNELSSPAFEELLHKRGIKKAQHVAFKAKYQKRSYRDNILVARNADQVEEYCRCVCGHLKCCYNLFSPNQFSGDDCPSNCRGLTKSNKYMRKAGYYRDKARHNRMAANKRKMTLLPSRREAKNDDDDDDDESKNGSDLKKKNNDNDEVPKKKLKNDVREPPELDHQVVHHRQVHQLQELQDKDESSESNDSNSQTQQVMNKIQLHQHHSGELRKDDEQPSPDSNTNDVNDEEGDEDVSEEVEGGMSGDDFENDSVENNPLFWSVTDVFAYLKKTDCHMFAPTLREHEVDGAALLLLDYTTITSLLYSGYTRQYTLNDALKLATLIDILKRRWNRLAHKQNK